MQYLGAIKYLYINYRTRHYAFLTEVTSVKSGFY